jgi:hypothetical protein
MRHVDKLPDFRYYLSSKKHKYMSSGQGEEMFNDVSNSRSAVKPATYCIGYYALVDLGEFQGRRYSPDGRRLRKQ